MKLSAYLTCRNAITMNYPIAEVIRGLYDIVDEIVVCDTSYQEEGSKELLNDLKNEFESIHKKEFKIIEPQIDWKANNSGIFDGTTKALARESCTGDYLIQVDLDEIFVGTREQVIDMINKAVLNQENPILSLPVVEPWGSSGKVRIDINPWKERISINDKNITHGIPGSHRIYKDGLLYSHPGSDGCNLINKNTLQPLSIINFVKPQIEQIRRLAITNIAYVPTYEKWFNNITDKMPYVYHLSWWSVYQKMLKYKLFWNNSWNSLYGNQQPEGYNPFFDKPFEEVSDQEMIETARKIEEESSGHIFHTPFRSGLSQKTNGLRFNKDIPNIIKDWCNKNKTP